ncbi:hypothetical protein ABEB36_001717 [Hypothenemus hampei]|uniref:USP domain-containing protein n=1 Tax=Hypothenemus hampei TaxID=57062 RepID=A0ABD1FFH2_HYPHA
MAVKHKNVVGPVNHSHDVRLEVILRALQYIPQESLDINVYSKIVMWLGTVAVPSNPTVYMKFMDDIQIIQRLLIKASESRNLICVCTTALYNEISNPDKCPSPVMSIVLQLIKPEFLPEAVKFILRQGYSEQNLEKALNTLCLWLTKWIWTENLGPLILAFMKGLEQKRFTDILMDITLHHIESLFKLIIIPENRCGVFLVVHHMLSSKQRSSEVFHKIIPQVPSVLTQLSKDETSKPYLYELVNLISSLIDQFPGYDELYEPITHVLDPFRVEASLQKPLNTYSWPDTRPSPLLTVIKVGLYNLGNTCYMNSVLQALFMIKPFRNKMLSHTKAVMPALFSKLQALFALLQHSNKSSLSPRDILALLRPNGFLMGHQHDSSEFLWYLLDTLHEQEKSVCDQESTTVVQECFGGKTMTISHCGECGTKSEKEDNFRELQLSIPHCADTQSVQQLLNYFLQSEKLYGDNQYRCDVCDRLTDGERITKIVSLPKHLVLTLKHFRYDQKSQTRTKLLQEVHLDNRICLEETYYDLYAAVVHHGSSVDSGHYYTFAKDSSQWYKFNDSSVNKSSEDSLHQLKPPESPYILFYSKENLVELEDLPWDALPSALKEVVTRDCAEMEKSGPKMNGIGWKKDDRPPPGCGGGGAFGGGTPGNMFVC